MARDRPFVALAAPTGRAVVTDLLVEGTLIAPPAFVDGTTVQGSGAAGDPLHAVAGAIAVAVDNTTIQGNGTGPFPLHVNPAALSGAIVSAVDGVKIQGNGTTASPLTVNVANLAALLAGLVAVVVDDVGIAGNGSTVPLYLHAGGVTNAKIANATITLPKMADIASSSLLGRVTAGVGAPEVLTGVQVASLLPVWGDYGDGSDGDAVLDGVTTVLGMVPSGGGVYTQPRDFFWGNLTILGGVTLKTNGYRDYIGGTLAGSGTISQDGTNGPSNTFNAGPAGTPAAVVGVGGPGGAAGTGLGNGSTSQANFPRGFQTGSSLGGTAGAIGTAGGAGGVLGGGGGGGGGGGDGQASTGFAGGISGASTAIAAGNPDVHDLRFAFLPWPTGTSGTKFGHGTGGGGGGRGASESTNFAGNGGASGGWVAVAIRRSTFTGTVSARGGNGGNGGGGTVGNAGGSGGGGGGQGGFVCVVVGSGLVPNVDVSGGAGGTGGAKAGTGKDGGAGGAARPGVAVVYVAGTYA